MLKTKQMNIEEIRESIKKSQEYKEIHRPKIK